VDNWAMNIEHRWRRGFLITTYSYAFR